jgi:thiamine-monophosphate kinase
MGEACGLRARIRLSDVPLADGVAEVARAAGRDPTLLAATGGEDYELLAALPPQRLPALRRALGDDLRVVGELVEGPPGVELVDGDGRPVAVARLGWEHGA